MASASAAGAILYHQNGIGTLYVSVKKRKTETCFLLLFFKTPFCKQKRQFIGGGVACMPVKFAIWRCRQIRLYFPQQCKKVEGPRQARGKVHQPQGLRGPPRGGGPWEQRALPVQGEKWVRQGNRAAILQLFTLNHVSCFKWTLSECFHVPSALQVLGTESSYKTQEAGGHHHAAINDNRGVLK